MKVVIILYWADIIYDLMQVVKRKFSKIMQKNIVIQVSLSC
jgi:hypothetical protein